MDFEEQLTALKIIHHEVKIHGLELTVDLGGDYINQILQNEKKRLFFKEMDIDFVRLDYGFYREQVKELYDIFGLRGFVINASIYCKKELNEIISWFKAIDEKIELRACHNFYIRDESGLEGGFIQIQNSFFEEHSIPVYYCIPVYSHPRGPLHRGLCTLESHRDQSIQSILCDLVLNHHLSAFMLADEWANEQEFMEVERTLALLSMPLHEVEEIPVYFTKEATAEERLYCKNIGSAMIPLFNFYDLKLLVRWQNLPKLSKRIIV